MKRNEYRSIRSDSDLPQTQGPSHAPHPGIVRVDGPPTTKRKPPEALPHRVGPMLARLRLRRRDRNLRPHRRGGPEQRRPCDRPLLRHLRPLRPPLRLLLHRVRRRDRSLSPAGLSPTYASSSATSSPSSPPATSSSRASLAPPGSPAPGPPTSPPSSTSIPTPSASMSPPSKRATTSSTRSPSSSSSPAPPSPCWVPGKHLSSIASPLL